MDRAQSPRHWWPLCGVHCIICAFVVLHVIPEAYKPLSFSKRLLLILKSRVVKGNEWWQKWLLNPGTSSQIEGYSRSAFLSSWGWQFRYLTITILSVTKEFISPVASLCTHPSRHDTSAFPPWEQFWKPSPTWSAFIKNFHKLFRICLHGLIPRPRPFSAFQCYNIVIITSQ